MATDSELEYLVRLIEEITTSLIVDNFKDTRNIGMVTTGKKCLVYPGETLSIDNKFYKKRYLVKLSMESEETMMGIINEIVDGFHLYNTSRAGLTNVATMCNVQYVYSGRSFIEANGRWNQDLWVDVEWVTS